MAAEVLCRAESKMRSDAAALGDKPTDLIPALADWLRDFAQAVEIAEEHHDGYMYDEDGNHWLPEELIDGHAFKVARAYLGELS